MALAMLGIVIAQLFRLQNGANPGLDTGLFRLGIPLACACLGLAIIVASLGAYRFWRQQNAMARHKCHAGGLELHSVGIIAFVVDLTSTRHILCHLGNTYLS